jgi:hypothetical protein
MGNERSQVILPLFEGGSLFWHVLVQVISVGCGSKFEDNQRGIGGVPEKWPKCWEL